MNFIIKFVPLMISLIALAFTGAGWWINREKLRLDLYNRRFEIYCRVLDLLFAFENWNPTGAETTACSLQDSPELDRALKAFTKAYRESQFLFDEKSGVHRQLSQLHFDAIAIIGSKRDLRPHVAGRELAELAVDLQATAGRAMKMPPQLEQAMKKYLDFQHLYSWW